MKHPILTTVAILGLAACLAACTRSAAEQSNTTSDFVSQMAMKAQGDINRLTPDERKELDRVTGGRTEDVIKFHPAGQMQPRDKK